MAGYTRTDTSNNIATGNVINAADFDGEYNAIETAFNATNGHAHDGTSGGGARILKVGPSGNLTFSAGAVTPLSNNAIDLGTSGAQFKDLYIDGVGYIDAMDGDVLFGSTVGASKLQFRDTAIYINSSADGQLDLVADTEIQIAATTIDINGAADISGNLAVGGNLTVTGTSTFNGGTLTLGDSASDNVVFGADVDSHIIPDDDDTYDLGSSDQEWRNLYINGTANIDSLVADTADINGGTIDATNITVGSGKTLDVSAGTLTLADNQISGDKVEGGTINATTVTTLTSTNGNITSVNATTVDTTNLETTNLKAKDGTAAGSIADSTGVVTLGSSVLTTADINGGTIDNTTIGGSSPAAITGTTITGTAITGSSFVIGDASIVETELETIDGVSAGTVSASKAVVVDSNKDITGGRNITITGELDTGSLTVDTISFNGALVTGSQEISVDAAQSINLDFGANAEVVMKEAGVNQISFVAPSNSQEIRFLNTQSGSSAYATIKTNHSSASSSELVLKSSGASVELDTGGGSIALKNSGTQRGYLKLDEAGKVKLYTGTGTGTLNATFDGNSVTATTFIGSLTGAATSLSGVSSSATELNLLDGSVSNTVVNSKAVVYGGSGEVQATTVDLGNWTVTENSGVLFFATGGTNKMKLDASGNLTVVGNVTAYGSM